MHVQSNRTRTRVHLYCTHSISGIYNAALKRKARHILYDPTHPLNEAFQKLPSGRRVKVPLAKKNLFHKSFIVIIPSVILIVNAKF